MKTIITLILITLVAGCSSTLPSPPEPKGDMVSANPSTIRLSYLEM